MFVPARRWARRATGRHGGLPPLIDGFPDAFLDSVKCIAEIADEILNVFDSNR